MAFCTASSRDSIRTPIQTGDMVAYDPAIYEDSDTGRKWHYTADGGWVYVDEAK